MSIRDKIKIEDKYYTVEEIKEALALKESFPSVGMGTKLVDASGNTEDIYVVTGFIMGGDEYAMLVDIKSGERWTDPIKVDDYSSLTREEYEELTDTGDFEIVED